MPVLQVPVLHVIVDGANVVGSRPDGWWRDRPGAARRLAGRLVAGLSTDRVRLVEGLVAAASYDAAESALCVHLVLEGAAARVEDLPTHPDLVALRAPADGDASIVALAAELCAEPVVVVTADRELRERVRASGATTAGPATLLRLLPG